MRAIDGGWRKLVGADVCKRPPAMRNRKSAATCQSISGPPERTGCGRTVSFGARHDRYFASVKKWGILYVVVHTFAPGFGSISSTPRAGRSHAHTSPAGRDAIQSATITATPSDV
jgi:hypothetical protein